MRARAEVAMDVELLCLALAKAGGGGLCSTDLLAIDGHCELGISLVGIFRHIQHEGITSVPN
jgi:hypothetical protein